MSGTLRSVIGPALARLRTYLEEANPIMDADKRTEEGMDRLWALQVKIKRTVSHLDEKMENWTTYIRSLAADEQAAEQANFDGFVHNQKHFADWLDEAREAIDEIYILEAGLSDEGSTHTSFSGATGNKAAHKSAVKKKTENRGNEKEINQLGEVANEVPKELAGGLQAANIDLRGRLPIHLPQTRLPEFWGDPMVYPEFKQAFDRTVDCQRIDEGLKAHYLIQCMKGKARRSLLGYRAIEEHYEPMKKALERIYGNEKAIRDALISELLSLKPCNESVPSLRSFIEDVERICRCLTAMGRLGDESVILLAIKNKLPMAIVLELLKKERDEKVEWGVENLRRGLNDIISLREEAFRCTELLGRRQTSQRENWRGDDPSIEDERFNGSGTNFWMNWGNESKRPFWRQARVKMKNANCYLCGGEHLTGNCLKYKRPYERMRILSAQDRCLICLKKGHAKNKCFSGLSCTTCKGNHHRIICTGDQQFEAVAKGNWKRLMKGGVEVSCIGRDVPEITVGKNESACGSNVISISGGKRKEGPKEMASQLDIPIANPIGNCEEISEKSRTNCNSGKEKIMPKGAANIAIDGETEMTEAEHVPKQICLKPEYMRITNNRMKAKRASVVDDDLTNLASKRLRLGEGPEIKVSQVQTEVIERANDDMEIKFDHNEGIVNQLNFGCVRPKKKKRKKVRLNASKDLQSLRDEPGFSFWKNKRGYSWGIWIGINLFIP